MPLSKNTDRRFEQAETMVEGVRWGAVVIQNKRKLYGIETILELIAGKLQNDGRRRHGWAPDGENDAKTYARRVAGELGIGMNDTIDVRRWDVLVPLIDAMIFVENGCRVPRKTIEAGVVAAGVRPEARPLAKSRTVTGSTVAGGAGAVAIGVSVAEQLAPAMPVLNWARDNWQFALILVGAAAILGAGYAIYARWDDRRKGLN